MSTQLQHRLQVSLGTAYSLERELGGAGMSRVFVATDTALGRRVVVKVLSPDLAAGISVERFKREILFAAQLQHPHIVPVFSVGELDGLPFFTMPFVDGESLRARLAREGPLPVDQVVSILRDVARALEYAHERGVVHRDIKPDNVLLAGSAAAVTDFGIAKAVEAAARGTRHPALVVGGRAHPPAFGGHPAESLTTLGTALGTPAYMAPEQAAGDPLIDHRADIYALGAMAYELLAGQPPFGGRSPQAQLVAHLIEAPEPVATRRPDAPAELADLVMRCLAKEPAERPQRAGEVLHALGALATPSSPQRAVAAEAPPSIAVLPFANLSADADNEYLSDGITEEILNALAQLRSIRVVARTSSFAFKGERLDAQEIGRRLRVSTILEGSIRRAGGRVRVSAQLINVADGYHLWSERYDRELKDIFQVQDDIAQCVVDALKATLLAPVSNPVVRRQETDAETYELYLRGRYFLGLRVDGATKAMECFRRALMRDPEYAPAHAGVADAYHMLTMYTFFAPTEGFPKAREAALQALALDPMLAEAHVTLACVNLWHDWDWPQAKQRFERARALNPNNANLHLFYGSYHASLGRFEEAIELAKRGVELDPIGLSAQTGFAQTLYIASRFEEAIERCRMVIDLNPSFSEAYRWAAMAYCQLGGWDDAITMAGKAVALTGRYPWSLCGLGMALAGAGRRAEARGILSELERRMGRERVPPLAIGVLYMGLGEPDRAIDWLERAFEARDFWLVMLAVEPGVAPLRGHPRFEDLLARVGARDGAAIS